MLGLVPAALALSARIDARVDAGLDRVVGTIAFDEPVALIDPLSRLPQPEDDRTRLRTFPGLPELGAVTWTPVAAFSGTWRFEARLPHRYGDVGVLEGRGLWANGGWYPQPLGDDGLPAVATWDVTVRLPEGPVGVVNGAVGRGVVRWRGEADRAALAVLRDAVVSRIDVPGGALTVVEFRRAERPLHRFLGRVVAAQWPLPAPPGLTIVEDLDLTRLARPAPGLLYLSERAGQLTPPFTAYHLAAVRRGLVAAAAPRAVGWEREFLASALTDALPSPSPEKLLGWLAWNPVVDALLHDGTIPFYADLFDDPFGGPPGLWDALGPGVPARAAALQLADLRGPDGPEALAHLMLGGATFAQGVEALALPEPLVAAWTTPARGDRDYAVRVERGQARVERRADPDAPAEAVIVEVDGEPLPAWVAGPGPATLDLGPAKRVRVDPDGHTRQEERGDDGWPPKMSVIVSGGAYGISPTQRNFDLELNLVLRRTGGTRGLWAISAEHDAQDLAAAQLAYIRYLGPLLDRRRRQHRLYTWAGPSLLDPDFRPTDEGAVAVGGGVQYAWETRTDDFYPLGGHRWAIGASGGFVPGSEERWASTGASVVEVWSPHPRQAWVLRTRAGWASGDVEHRLLPLGGAEDVRAIAEDAVVGNQRLSANLEWRLVPLRHAAIPGLVGWLTEVHVSPGLEGGVGWREGLPFAAAGATLGVHSSFDFLGANPSQGGMTLAVPVWAHGFDPGGVQFYIDFWHPF